MPGALLKLLVKDKLPHSRITEVVMSTFAHARPHNAMHSPSYMECTWVVYDKATTQSCGVVHLHLIYIHISAKLPVF